MPFYFYLLGFVPSLIWLYFYLRKDAHPESNRMVIKMFILGVISGFIAIVLEKAIEKGIHLAFGPESLITAVLIAFIGVAFIEELSKYITVRWGAHKDPELDEPYDIMLYMIIAALGFAALENILTLLTSDPTLGKTLETLAWRFISATFLHALCSGVIGYFLALSFYKIKKRQSLVITGITIASILHGVYNFSIMKIEGLEKFIIPFLVLLILAWFVSLAIKKLKRLKSICKTYPNK